MLVRGHRVLILDRGFGCQQGAEFVLGHADQDRSMPPSAIDALGDALSDAGLAFSNEVYPDGPHGYTMADTTMYHEPSAERHYAELRALLERTL